MSSIDTPVSVTWGKWDKLSLQLILAAVAIYAVLVLITGAIAIVSTLISGEHLLSLAVDGALPPEADAGSATLIDGRYESARVYIGDLTPATSGLLVAGLIVNVLTQLLVAASFAYLAFRLLQRRPFLRSLTWSFVVAGAALLIGSIIAQTLGLFGSWLATTELGATGEKADFWQLAFTIDPAPLGFGVGLMLVGSAFEYAQKLSRDTEGLV
jgi:hypothetical protein